MQKTIDDTRTIILDHIAKFPKANPVETASALINAVLEDNDLFGIQDRCAIVDSVNSKTCQHDVISDIPGARNDRVAADRTAPGQSMYNVENYFTQKIWHRLREPTMNKHMVYLEITKLLVQLGLHRPIRKVLGSFGRHYTMGCGRETASTAD